MMKSFVKSPFLLTASSINSNVSAEKEIHGMANELKIELDTLTPNKAEQLAAFILGYAGVEQIQQEPDNETEMPFEILKPEPDESKLSSDGPVLEISSVSVDSAGLPWDARIHSASRSLNADGTWRAKRGLNTDAKVQVEKELHQVMSIPSPPQPQQTQVPASIVEQTVDPDVAHRQAFMDLIGRTSAALAARKISEDQVTKICTSVGIANLPLLGLRLDLVPQVAPMIDGIIAAQA
jgi:hypothetical protein